MAVDPPKVKGERCATLFLVSRPRVILVRGYSVNPWDLRPWEGLQEDFDIRVLITGRNDYAVDLVDLEQIHVRATRNLLPRSRISNVIAYGLGDRMFGVEDLYRSADIVHVADIGTWFSGQAAALRRDLGFKLVATVWETIPFMATYRMRRDRRYREQVIREGDLFLAATDRARMCLELEGIAASRIAVSYPGIDLDHFKPGVPRTNTDPIVLSPGRLVWEKGHQDAIRALAAIRKGLVPAVDRTRRTRLRIVGGGPDRKRLEQLARELNVLEAVEFVNHVGYDAMPAMYAACDCMMLMSLPRRGWEEQFGMVLAEAMACGVPIVASDSGAIPEVVASTNARLVSSGSWFAAAEALVATLEDRQTAGERAMGADLEKYSVGASSERIRQQYSALLAK
jgi:glycosyltransferase involved in cell wall biosynthesis